MKDQFFDKGWCRFPYDPVLADWVDGCRDAAQATVTAPEFDQWHRCEGTWFVGVNALPNDEVGAVNGGPALAGDAVSFIREALGMDEIAWDRGQVSVCYPGYPKPMESESDASFRFRRDRDAAHVDGLRKEGPDARRYLLECHGFILGIPLVAVGEGASPIAVWEGSHHLVRDAFEQAFDGVSADAWNEHDITEPYQAVRREIFKSCKRITLTAQPGEAYLIHRLTLHGISPWQNGATAGPDGRMIAYFRPELAQPRDWVYAP